MTTKKIALALSYLAVSGLVFTSCKKGTPNEVPVPDTEVQTAIDASWATFVVSDIETICSLMGENKTPKDNELYMYNFIPGTQVKGVVTATVDVTRDTTSKEMNTNFNLTSCMDGKLREGGIFMKYGRFSPVDSVLFPNHRRDSEYMHNYGFGGLVSFSEYKVDGWKIVTPGTSKFTITALMPSVNYDPAQVQLSWRLKGSFIVIPPTGTDVSKGMTLDVDLVKTLVNSTDKRNVFYASTVHRTDSSIHWNRAKVTYTGKVTGTTAGNIPFTLVFDEAHPLFRDFTCSPSPIAGIALTNTVGVINTLPSTFHPFIMGIGSFTTSNAAGETLYPRQIYYGNEGASVEGGAQCENVGEVLIKGISYSVNFRE